ncbi:MAG: DUF1501 domain-containing protein, partial [Saprospiraceae bacterium]
MGGGFAGLALTSLLNLDGFFGRHVAAGERVGHASPYQPHFKAKAKSCIFLMMNGAPSQVDTFDYKPLLQRYAGQPLPEGKAFTNSGGRK